MNNCPDCERTRETLLEILKTYAAPQVYDRNKGPSVTNEELLEVVIRVLGIMQREIDNV